MFRSKFYCASLFEYAYLMNTITFLDRFDRPKRYEKLSDAYMAADPPKLTVSTNTPQPDTVPFPHMSKAFLMPS
jgi:hypothetical protein